MMFFKALPGLLFVGAVSAASDKTYDYVIVGGGTAGSALATRLSLGLPNAQILLLEAGPSALDELRINVPGLRGSILGTNYDWNFTTVDQSGLGGRQIAVNRGKVLGGSSAMNYLCYDRASSPEYESWAEMGSEGWTWNTMIEAMTQSENFTGSDNDPRGRSGPIRNTYNRVIYDVLNTWQPAGSELGLPINEEGNMHGNPIGIMFQGTNIDNTDYSRSYSANSYLPLAGSNLVVQTNSQVVKVNLEKAGENDFSATGVTLSDGSVINAAKEVILSAGSIQSPGILELSGIGQAAVIEAAGVTPVIDLPGVGENYQDHIRTSNVYRLKDGIDSFDNLIFDAGGENATAELQKWIDGEVSLYDYTSAAYGFLNWGQVDTQAQADLIALAEAAVGSSTNPIDQKKLEFLKNDAVPDYELIFEANHVGAAGYPGSGKFITIFSTVMHALSRGNVHIDRANPTGKPIVDPKYLSNEHDVKAAIEGSKFARKIAEAGPIKAMWEAETEPGPDVQTDEQFREFAVNTVNSFYHPVGTCSLLPRDDGGVVDADLKVYGTKNLRVVDNSIVPIIISGHIQTAAYGIAEVAAAKIISEAA
ncbi:choline dehydrogenase [Colletotrichum karsti]|uniref:Choline dehydrogenase n=1 Tax=Colletotrichum karsti TaxID=1095194 RepID=A0A9P6HTS3_9PEZI|nr:choline dehydrogenase [Colletotrichum karsti]KAF9870968.1 choline dehydrogenase [Colletotrichum karsti]